MGKYAISKLSIILYHKQTNLSIGFVKNPKKFLQNCLLGCKKPKESRYRSVNHALIAAILNFYIIMPEILSISLVGYSYLF